MITGLIDFTTPGDLNRILLTNATSRETFLDVFLGQVAKLKNVDKLFVAYTKETESFLGALAPYGIRAGSLSLPDRPEGYLYDNYKRVKKSRLWAYNSIRGGLHDTTVFDEIMPMPLIKKFAENAKDIDGVLHLHPSMPLFDPGYADSLCVAADHDAPEELSMLTRLSMVGACPAFVTRRGLRKLKEKNWAPFHVFLGEISGDGLIAMENVVRHNMTYDLMRESLTLFTERDAERLRTLLLVMDNIENLERNAAGYADALRRRLSILEAGKTPREIDIDLPPSLVKVQDLLENVYREAVSSQVLLTIGATKSALHLSTSRYEDVVRQLAKVSRPHGLQIRADASDILRSPHIASEWIGLCDVFAITMDVPVPTFDQCLEMLAEKSRSNPDNAVIHLELPFDHDTWVAIHHVANAACKNDVSFNWIPNESMNYVPSKRGPCEKRRFQLYIDSGLNARVCKHSDNAVELEEHFCISRAWGRIRCVSMLDACDTCKNWTTT